MEQNTNEEIPSGMSKSMFKEWLEKLQQESWQLELIISGFALFGIYSSKGALVDLNLYAENITSRAFIDPLIFLMEIGWKIFFINLLLHVILRSLWIGAIGLRYVSADIDYKALNYSEYFTQYLRKKVGDYDDFIERLEKICSVLFSYTFLLFLLFLSTLAFLMGIALPVIIFDYAGVQDSEENIFYALWWIFPYLFLGIVVFIDFITLGVIKRIKDKTVSKIYLPVYRFYSFITLSFLYRPLLYNFIDEKYTRKLFYFSLPYIFIIAFGDSMFSENTYPFLASKEQSFQDGSYLSYKYYDDLYLERNKFLSVDEFKDYKQTANIRLSAYRMNDNFASIFVKHAPRYTHVLEKKYGLTPIYDPGWHFTLFGNEKFEEDAELKAIEERYENEYKFLDKRYREIRDSMRHKEYQGEAMIQSKTEERSKIQDSKQAFLKEKSKALSSYKREKAAKILEAIQGFIDIKIDGIDYTDSLTCYQTVHPNNQEEGLICNFNIEHLEKGNHLLELKRTIDYVSEKDSILSAKYRLPFIKQF